MPNQFKFDVSFNGTGQSGQRRDPARFKILVLGDFSGRGDGSSLPRSYRPFPVDCDNLEQRMAGLSPSVDLNLEETAGATFHLEFSELEDFHPDRLYDRIDCFDELRKLGEQLLDPKTFAEAAKKMTGEDVAVSAPQPVKRPAAGIESFSDLLEKPVIPDREQARSHPAVSRLLHKFVTPHVLDAPGPEQDRLLESLDMAVSGQMREILQHDDFRSLESAWRSLDFLVRALELGEALSLHILDLSKSHLAAELSGGVQAGSGLFRTLVTDAGGTAGTEPWSLVIALYDFAANDSGLLTSIGELARRAGTTIFAGISFESLLTETTPDWESLRHSDAASHLCLSTPGLLLRLPYGAETDAIDRFEFEEIPGNPEHRHYLWGSAALVCGALIGKSLGREDVRPGSIRRLDGLPVHSYKVQGEYTITPCGGAWLSDSDADRLIKYGITPVLSIRNSDAVQVVGFQTLASGPISI